MLKERPRARYFNNLGTIAGREQRQGGLSMADAHINPDASEKAGVRG